MTNEDSELLKQMGKEGGTQIPMGYVLAKQLLLIGKAADSNLMLKENRNKWKATVRMLKSLLVNEWTDLKEDSDFKTIDKEISEKPTGQPIQEIQKTWRLFEQCVIIAKPLLPQTKIMYETLED